MKSKGSLDIIGTAALLGLILFSSTTPAFLRLFIEELDGWTTNGVRYPFAALLWIGPLIYQIKRGNVNRRIWTAALVPTIPNFIGQAGWAWVPYYLDVSRMGFLSRSMVACSIVAALLFFRDERPLLRSPRFWVGIVLSVGGFTAMSLAGVAMPTGSEWLGIGILLTSSFGFGLYSVGVRYSLEGTRPWVAFPVICLYTSVGTIIMMATLGEPGRLQEMSFSFIGILLLSSIVGIAGAHVCFFMSIERLGVTLASSGMLAMPFWTYLWAFLFFDESLTLIQWIGGFVLLIGGGYLISAQTALRPFFLGQAK